jgi:group I intron endonuclease
MFYSVYKVTNKIDGKFYIGTHKTRNLDDDYMGSGKYLKHAQNKYGIENFHKEILFVFNTAEEMFRKEAELVTEEFIETENTYNLKVGGNGGFHYINKTGRNIYGNNGHVGFGGENLSRDRIHSDEERKRISETLKEGLRSGRIKKSFLGKSHSDQTKKLISDKMTELQSGPKNSQYGTMWITDGVENKKVKRASVMPEGWHRGRSKVS